MNVHGIIRVPVLHRNTFRGAILVIVLGLVAVPVADASAQQEALVLLRILAYDRKLGDRTSDDVSIIVVYKPGDAKSEAAAKDIAAQVAAAAKKVSVSGRKVRVRSEGFTADFGKNLSNTAALYVCLNLDDSVEAISQVARGKRILSFTNVESYLSVLAIGIVPRDKAKGIIVNLKAAKAEGADLDSALLKLADVRK
jgi:hypothetical protein